MINVASSIAEYMDISLPGKQWEEQRDVPEE